MAYVTSDILSLSRGRLCYSCNSNNEDRSTILLVVAVQFYLYPDISPVALSVPVKFPVDSVILPVMFCAFATCSTVAF